MREQTFSRQYLRNVVSSLVHEGHDPFIKYAELKYVQRAYDATMASSACAGWLALNRVVESLEARAKARTCPLVAFSNLKWLSLRYGVA